MKTHKLLTSDRQKRKLEEMYDQLKSEYESMKRSAIQPADSFYTRVEPDLFSSPATMVRSRDATRKGSSVLFKAWAGHYAACLDWQTGGEKRIMFNL